MQPEKRVRCKEPEEPKDVLTIMKRLGAKASGLSPWFWEDELPEPDYTLRFREPVPRYQFVGGDLTPIQLRDQWQEQSMAEMTTYGLVEIPNTGERLVMRRCDNDAGLIIES